ncbi:MAG: polyprenyl synthetase family protein [Crocinitomicaceae bacterium]|jgi:octaprenyl-diphosphate synthase|nr:polyprenyl synthetase family protein [Crocinitomicaceae bacterium]MDP4760863.1 polyprenyl synthetase family protein [Crocinitomicaceae bacterium]
MQKVEDIMAPIQSELDAFESYFKDSMKSDVALLDKVTQYIVKRKGKQMRPMFVFLTAKMLGEINQVTYDATTLVELLHTATLVHDDVVDDANERRGFFSVNALWKNKIAVLVGDYMLSRILLLSIEKENLELLEVVARAVREMSEGELLQIEKARDLNIDEEIYFEVIRKKTASLISTCCEAGAISVHANDHKEKMRKFGELIGLAFQIKDDIFDYGSGEHIGKPTGIDIREQKMTLPLIYVMNHSSPEIRKELMYIMKNEYDVSAKIKRVIQIVIEYGGIQYATQKMQSIAHEALEILVDFPDNDAKNALIGLVHYTMNREK